MSDDMKDTLRHVRLAKKKLGKNILDIAKCVALGAILGGMAGQFLKAAAVSTENTVETIQLVKRQIEVTMFAAGAGTLDDLAQNLLKV